jgi:cobalamin biosynthesis Co2+ chelatase CbiK
MTEKYDIIFCILERGDNTNHSIETWGKPDLKKMKIINVSNLYTGLKFIHDNFDYNYIFVCGTDDYVIIENLVLYIEKEEKNNRISPNNDIIICGKEENPYNFILTKKSIKTVYHLLDTNANKQSIYYYLRSLGTGFIITEHLFLNSEILNQDLNSVFVCRCASEQGYNDLMRILKKEKEKSSLKKQELQRLISRLYQ